MNSQQNKPPQCRSTVSVWRMAQVVVIVVTIASVIHIGFIREKSRGVAEVFPDDTSNNGRRRLEQKSNTGRMSSCEENSSPPHILKPSPLVDRAAYSRNDAKRTTPVDGSSSVSVDATVCDLLPAHLSSSRLWNEHVMEWILPGSVQMWMEGNIYSKNTDDESTMKKKKNNAWIVEELLTRFITSTELRQGLRSSPSLRSWGHLLTKLDKALRRRSQQLQKDMKPPPVVMVVLGAQLEDPDNNASGGGTCSLPREIFDHNGANFDISKASKNSDDGGWHCAWPFILQGILNRILSLYHHQSDNVGVDDDVIRIVPVMLEYSNTEFASIVAKYDLWPQSVLEVTHGKPPDIIVNSYSSHDMANLNRTSHVGDSINFQENLRSMQQEFIRNVITSQPCDESSVPAVLYLDDYLGGHGHDDLYSETTLSRIVQRLADWYSNTGMGFVSYASVVRPFVYADTNSGIFWNNNKESVGDKYTPSLIYHGRIAQMIMAWTMAFAMLQYTVDYCSYREVLLDSPELANQPLSYLKDGVAELVSQVIPPRLTLSTSMISISQEWEEERTLQEKRKEQICHQQAEKIEQSPMHGGSKCPLHFWKGHNQDHPVAGGDLNSYKEKIPGWLDNLIDSNQGWNLLARETNDSRDMIWNAQDEQASLTLVVPLTHGPSTASVHLFVKTYSDLVVQSPSRLLVEALESHGQHKRKIVSNTHPSDVTLARHYHLDLWSNHSHGEEMSRSSSRRTTATIKLTQVEKGTVPIEIVAMMVCNDKEVILRSRRSPRT